jgi:hypothetical protein
VIKYLTGLIERKDYDLMVNVAQSLYELIIIRDERVWTEAYNCIINFVKQDLSQLPETPDLDSKLFVLDII